MSEIMNDLFPVSVAHNETFRVEHLRPTKFTYVSKSRRSAGEDWGLSLKVYKILSLRVQIET